MPQDYHSWMERVEEKGKRVRSRQCKFSRKLNHRRKKCYYSYSQMGTRTEFEYIYHWFGPGMRKKLNRVARAIRKRAAERIISYDITGSFKGQQTKHSKPGKFKKSSWRERYNTRWAQAQYPCSKSHLDYKLDEIIYNIALARYNKNISKGRYRVVHELERYAYELSYEEVTSQLDKEFLPKLNNNYWHEKAYPKFKDKLSDMSKSKNPFYWQAERVFRERKEIR